MEERTLLKWTVKHKGLFTSRRSFLIIAVLFVISILFYATTQKNIFAVENISLFVIVGAILIFIFITNLSKKEIDFVMTKQRNLSWKSEFRFL